MRRICAFVLVMLLALVIAGCIDYSEVIELNADGSGTLAMHLIVYKHYFTAMSEMMSSLSGDSVKDSTMFQLFTRKDLEKKLKERKSSIKLIDFIEQQSDSTVIYDVKYSFKDLHEMLKLSEEMGKGEMMGEPAAEPEISFRKDKSGQWQFVRAFEGASMGEMMQPPEQSPVPEDRVADTSKTSDSLLAPMVEAVDSTIGQMGSMMTGMAEMMKKAFANRKMQFTVKFPGVVTESNATSKSGNTAVWEYKFADLAKAPKQLQATIKP